MGEGVGEDWDWGVVGIERSGRDGVLSGRVVKRVEAVNVDIDIKGDVMMSD